MRCIGDYAKVEFSGAAPAKISKYRQQLELSNFHGQGRDVWVLHIAKVAYFFLFSLPNVEWPILGPLPFFFYQKSFIFRFLENCFWEPNLYIAVG